MKKTVLIMLCAIMLLIPACIQEGGGANTGSEEQNQNSENKDMGENNMSNGNNIEGSVAYFAGGCFWGMEKFMSKVPGVIDVISGYANGDDTTYTKPTYEQVLTDKTGFKEAVKVIFDESRLDYEMLLRAYYIAIDPTVSNRQGNDIGTQYQTGIFYLDDNQKETAFRVSDEIKASVNSFAVLIEPFKSFYDAEEYHQDYLVKNPMGYCHISDKEIEEMEKIFETYHKSSYVKPSDEEIKSSLTALQYEVTQNAATEQPFNNEFWNYFEKGLYVDIVTGEPLFTSMEKYESSCGWPAFSSSRNEDIQYLEDTSYNMIRTEVRSGIGDSHLGHVFYNDVESPTGVRFCINSASLRFIPFARLDEEGYGYTKSWFEQ